MKRISIFLSFVIFVGCAAPGSVKKLSKIETTFYNDLFRAFNEAEESYTESKEIFIQRNLKWKEMEVDRADREKISVILTNFKQKSKGKAADKILVQETLAELDKLSKEKLDALKQYGKESAEKAEPIIAAFNEIQKVLLLIIDNQDKIDGYVQNKSTQLFNIDQMKETIKDLEKITDALIKLEQERKKR